MTSERGQRRQRTLALAALLAYTLVLVVGTHMPHPPQELAELAGSDKRLHFAAYFVLAGLAAANLALRGWFHWRAILTLACGLATFAALDEITQPWVGREADLRDWLADQFGMVCGLAAFALAWWLTPHKSPHADRGPPTQ